MSQYLIDQIAQTPNIAVMSCSQVVAGIGNGRLEKIDIRNLQNGEVKSHPTAALFVFIGNRPITDWLGPDIIKDPKGFVETGRELRQYEQHKKQWKLDREPFLLETSVPGIFAAGDVRAGAMNRVASAVGEGSMTIKMVHEYLATV
ncbi:MAG: NAD(P)/FAD-dependent oxidoreductase [Cyclobacteriaceae bacterium]